MNASTTKKTIRVDKANNLGGKKNKTFIGFVDLTMAALLTHRDQATKRPRDQELNRRKRGDDGLAQTGNLVNEC